MGKEARIFIKTKLVILQEALRQEGQLQLVIMLKLGYKGGYCSHIWKLCGAAVASQDNVWIKCIIVQECYMIQGELDSQR